MRSATAARSAAGRACRAANPHLGLYRLPSYSPCLNVVERFWKKLRRRATHNQPFDTIADLIHDPADAVYFTFGKGVTPPRADS